MNNLLKIIMVCLAILTLGGCSHATDRTLSPPSDTRWVNVEVKNPSRYTRPFPLEVLYISNTCKRKLMSMRDGSHYEKPGYNPIKIPLQQQGSSDIWRAKVAMTGGGSCDWRLSEFNLGIEYTDATHLGKDLMPGTAVGATIAFDNSVAHNGQFTLVNGNKLSLSPQYYPLIDSNKRISKNDTLNLFGEEDFLQRKMIGMLSDVSVIFTPGLDESKVVRMVAPEKYKEGSYYRIIYPDGTVVSDGSTHPDVRKLKE